MSEKDVVRAHYLPKIAADAPGYAVCDWGGQYSQEKRFGVLVEHIPLTQTTKLLDVGCGVGDLWGYLCRSGIACHYLGVDLLQEMTHEARRRHPDATFLPVDLFGQHAPPLECDVAFCSGMLNLAHDKPMLYLSLVAGRLRQFSSQAVMVNLLNAETHDPGPAYQTYMPEGALNVCWAAGWRQEIISGYLPNDFTLLMTKVA